MLRLEPGRPGDQIRLRPQLQAPDHAGENEFHLLQLPPLRLQPHPLFPEALQGSGGVLPPEAAADVLQGRARLAENGDGVVVIELFRVIVEIPVFPPVGRGQQPQVLVVPQSLLGCAAQGGKVPGGQTACFPLHKRFLPKWQIPS